jgi:hypothetical protein
MTIWKKQESFGRITSLLTPMTTLLNNKKENKYKKINRNMD